MSSFIENFLMLAFFILLIGGGIIVFILIDRTEKMRDMQQTLLRLQSSFNELDEQAKLIVKTDLELNRTQEELDKRLNGLDALQKISRLISSTLNEDEAFQRLDPSLLNELGFEKYLIMTTGPNERLICRLSHGFTPETTEHITARMQERMPFIMGLRETGLISSSHASLDEKKDLADIFEVRRFVLAPISTPKTVMGLIFAGNSSEAYSITEGDEELISILADQMAQTLENALLFEEVFKAQQGLELKVQERTRQLSMALEKVQQISNLKSEFISAVSHELRTPLTSIKGYASILITGKAGDVPEKVRERLQKINKHSDNLVKLINDLLDISRIESGKTEMKFISHDVPSIVENTQDLLTPQMRDKSINFVKDIAPQSPMVPMDASQIERVFINLIGNAIKFTPESGTISVSVKHDDKRITCSVSDTGIGIDQENLKKLFSEFFRVDNEVNQNVKGTGLGLALAKKIVEAHKGRIWVTSEVGKGTIFYFTLPLSHQQNDTAVSAGQPV